ncbi:hypothetical protein BDL97_11G107400 [Sphagnum fallax]|nr:hypothetical protein BDL97_11G107400 [Sphagnum fallax]
MSLDGKNSSTMVGGEGEENAKPDEEEQQRQDLEEGEGSGQAAPAAMHIQRRYRGYRVRRKVADAAVMANISWWNAVDAATLLQNTEHYYAYKKNSSNASSNWSRLQKKAAKVGKGLSRDSKALKLALQHWLEAVDAQHRYGHNLHPYYKTWLNCNTNEPFFYWLDVGEGRDLDLPECLRSTLQKEHIRYLGPAEREQYEVIIEHGKLYYKLNGCPVDTPKPDRWIFVMSPAGKFYVGPKRRGSFQHSSFLAGGATIAAGRLHVNDGVVELMEAHSGHYRPSPGNFQALIQLLMQSGADLTMAKVMLVSEDQLDESNKTESDDRIKACQGSTPSRNCGEEGAFKSLITNACAEEAMAVVVEEKSIWRLDNVLNEGVDCSITTLLIDGNATTDHQLLEISSPLMNGIEDNNSASEVTSTIMNGIGDNNSAPEVANPVTNENEDNEASEVTYPLMNGNEDDKAPKVLFETMGVCKAEQISPDKEAVQTLCTPGYSRISSLTRFSPGQCSRFL